MKIIFTVYLMKLLLDVAHYFCRLVLKNGHSHILLTLEVSVMMNLNRSQ